MYQRFQRAGQRSLENRVTNHPGTWSQEMTKRRSVVYDLGHWISQGPTDPCSRADSKAYLQCAAAECPHITLCRADSGIFQDFRTAPTNCKWWHGGSRQVAVMGYKLGDAHIAKNKSAVRCHKDVCLVGDSIISTAPDWVRKWVALSPP